MAEIAGQPLGPISRRARDWLFDACFPFWADRGVDPRGGFYERLDLAGAPIVDATSRVRVQARQTYVYAEAALLGWEPTRARSLTQRGVETMLGACRRPDLLFGRLIIPGAGLHDDQPDLYDNAFSLMALAYASKALAAPELLREADKTIAAIDRLLAHPSGGFRESLPDRLPRRQNPHMHLFEALIALHGAAPDRGYLERARAILSLFKQKFFDERTQTLTEYFTSNLDPAPGAEGDVIEPGHQFEWTWLLSAYARAADASDPAIAPRLYAATLPFLDAAGLAPQTATRLGGRLIDASRRAWPQTEALKAHLARCEAGDPDAAARATMTATSLFRDYLQPAPLGGWIDHYDASGASIAQDIPASTGYHIVLAFAELMRVAANQA